MTTGENDMTTGENETSTGNTFAGRPIVGDIGYYSRTPTPQAPASELIALLDAVLALPGVDAVQWEQYTPYFNDGDVCVFSVHEPEFRMMPIVRKETPEECRERELRRQLAEIQRELGMPVQEPESDEQDSAGEFHEKWYLQDGDWGYAPLTDEEMRIVETFTNALVDGSHFVALHEHFGDPAQVTATSEGFRVEYYSHD